MAVMIVRDIVRDTDRRRREFKNVRAVAKAIANELEREVDEKIWRAAELSVLASEARMRALSQGAKGLLYDGPTPNDLVRLERLASAARKGLAGPCERPKPTLREVLELDGRK